VRYLIKGLHEVTISNAGNYRPVSLTCIVCKVLETIVRESIVNHMQVHKLYSNKQFEFISERSTSTGPRTDPCGFPEVTDFHSEDSPLTDTFCLQLSKNEPIRQKNGC
jgi:hypothetical protein